MSIDQLKAVIDAEIERQRRIHVEQTTRGLTMRHLDTRGIAEAIHRELQK